MIDDVKDMACSFVQIPEIGRFGLVRANLYVITSPEGYMNQLMAGKSLEDATRRVKPVLLEVELLSSEVIPSIGSAIAQLKQLFTVVYLLKVNFYVGTPSRQ